MSGYTDVPSPGGWLQTYGLRVARMLTIGVIAAGGGVAAVHYGTYNGGEQQHYCESTLTTKTTNKVTYSCLNPLPEGQSGVILKDTNGFVFVSENASPQTKLQAGTATTATLSGTNLFNATILNQARRLLTVTGTGALPAGNHIVLAPRDSNGAKYLNFSFSAGSGQTATGKAPAYVRIPIIPCLAGIPGC